MTERISRHQMWMQMAEIASRRSTCMRRNVGCIIVKDNNIVSLGYNGSPPGQPHCLGKLCVPPTVLGCQRAIHAEWNAINRLPEGLTRDLVMYSTESPCSVCANKIITFDAFKELYYTHLYRDTEGVDRLALHMPVFRITPSGWLISHKTGELIDAS
jgi:dCMP deaminase